MSDPTFVQIAQTDPGNSAGATTQTAVLTSAIVAGDALIVACLWFDTTNTVSITDTSGNTYVRLAPIFRGGTESGALFWARNVKAAAASANTVTATWSGATTFQVLQVAEYSNARSVYGVSLTQTTSAGPAQVTFAPRRVGDKMLCFGAYPLNDQTVTILGGNTLRGIITPNDQVGLAELNASTTASAAAGFNIAASDTWWALGLALSPDDSVPVLAQQRTPGFPLGAPLPGIALLGSGILQVGQPPFVPPSGSFPDRPSRFESSRASVFFGTTFIAPPAAPTFTPQPPQVDRQAYVGQRTLEPAATQQLPNPAIFQPLQPWLVDQPMAPTRQAAGLATSQWIAEATFQPTPQAVYPDQSRNTRADGFVVNLRVDPASFQPVPRAVFVDSSRGSRADSFWANQWQNPAGFQPTPQAIYTDASRNTRSDGLYVNAWQNPAAFQPNPQAFYADTGSARPNAADRNAHLFVAFEESFPAIFQPNPVGSWPDRGSSSPRTVDVAATPYVQPPAAVSFQPTSWAWPDARRPEPARVGFEAWRRIDPAGFQPIPEAVFQDTARNTRADGSFTQFIPPPVIVPPPVFPDSQTPPARRAELEPQPTPRWIDPAGFRPTPEAIFVDQARNTRADGFSSTYVQVPPPQNPAASFPDMQAPAQRTAHLLPQPPGQWIDPAKLQPVPQAVFWDRAQTSSRVADGAWVNRWQAAPAPYVPEPWYPDSHRPELTRVGSESLRAPQPPPQQPMAVFVDFARNTRSQEGWLSPFLTFHAPTVTGIPQPLVALTIVTTGPIQVTVAYPLPVPTMIVTGQ